MDKPNWTVLYNIISPENSKYVGTGWEFFDKEEDADKCYARHRDNGCCPSKRPFFEKLDRAHMGAARRFRAHPVSGELTSVSLVDASHIKSQWQAHFMQIFPICMDNLPRFHKSDKSFFNENWQGDHNYSFDEFIEKYYPNF